MDGDNAIEALARAIETHMGLSVPYRMAAGVSAIANVAANSGQQVSVTLPVGRFTAIPIVHVTPISNGWAAGSAGNVVAASFSARMYNPTATGLTGCSVQWSAVQMLPGAGPSMAADSRGVEITHTATCHTDGCDNAGEAIGIAWEGDEYEIPYVVCGVCGQPIEDVA